MSRKNVVDQKDWNDIIYFVQLKLNLMLFS